MREIGDSGLVTALLLDGKGGARAFGWDEVRAWKPDDGVLWLNFDYRKDDAQAWLRSESGIDPSILGALLDADPRPRATTHDDDSLMLVVRAINLNQGAEPEDMVSLRCWAEPRRVVTLRHRRLRASDAISAELQRGRGPKHGGELVARLVEFVLEPLVASVDAIDETVSDVEEKLLGGGANLRSKLVEDRRRAIALRRFIAPQRDAWARLPSLPLAWLAEPERVRLREAADRLTRTLEELDAARDRAALAYEELASQANELTNKRLYLLAIVTVLFAPLGFVTSLLGVNVGGVPGRELEWGFWLLIAALASATGLLTAWLHRRGWLGRG